MKDVSKQHFEEARPMSQSNIRAPMEPQHEDERNLHESPKLGEAITRGESNLWCSISPPSVSVDCCAPRGPLDFFVRSPFPEVAWDDTKIGEAEDINLKYYSYDDEVEKALHTSLNWSVLEKCSCIIQPMDGYKPLFTFSGAILSDRVVMTCRHAFTNLTSSLGFVAYTRLANGEIFSTSLEPLEDCHSPSLQERLQSRYLMNGQLRWMTDDIDCIFMKCRDPFPIDPPFLSFSADLIWNIGDVVSTIGWASALRNDEIAFNLLPTFLQEYLDTLYGDLKHDMAKKIYKRGFCGLDRRVQSFGSIDIVPNRSFGGYGAATMSVREGMSGGPVVLAKDPTKLIGIQVGGYTGSPFSIFASTHVESVYKTYRMYVKE